MMEKRDLAKQDYLDGMKYKDIAAKYDVSISAVKSWKSRYWSDDKVATKPTKKVATKKEKVATKVAEELTNNDDLNERQKMFCLFYLQSFNATQSYIKAYNVDFKTANVSGPRLLVNVSVQEQLSKLKKELTKELAIDTQDVINEYAKQAFSDIGDFVKFGNHDEIAIDMDDMPILDTNDEPVIIHRSYVQFKDQDKVDTSLIKSVKMGKDGPVMELYDKQKAMDKVLEYLNGNKSASDAELSRNKARISKVDADNAEGVGDINPILKAITNKLSERDGENEDMD